MLLDRVLPYGKNCYRLQLLFLCLIVTDLLFTAMVLICSVDAIPLQHSVGLFVDVVNLRLHRLQASGPKPCTVSNSLTIM